MNKSYIVINLDSITSPSTPYQLKGNNSYYIVGEQNHEVKFELADGENIECVDSTTSCSLNFKLNNDASLSLVTAKTTQGKSHYHVDIKGRGCNCNLKGITIGTESNKIEIYTTVKHLNTNCNSSQLFKAVGGGSSISIFEGVIYVACGADSTISLQENKNILLSEKAQILSRPWLEIYADDVKCSHGSSTGKLSEEEIYYMRQRGISEQTARKLQLEGFALDIVEAIKNEELCQKIELQILEVVRNV